MGAFIDLLNQRFGRLRVIERMPNNKKNQAVWKCQCDCGRIVIVASGHLRSGHSRKDLKLYNKIGTIKLCLTDGIPSVYLDDELIGSWPNNTNPTFNVTPVMFIGDGLADTYARFYSFIIADGDDIKFNGIPCISPDNVVGMYDLVTESFFGNAGGTAFIAGNPV